MKSKLLLFSFLFLFIACGSDPCEEVDCGPNGTCDSETGTCICDAYYEGSVCEIESREKFIGTWTGMGECDYNMGSFFDLVVEISKGGAVNEINFKSTQILQEFSIYGRLDQDNNIQVPTFKWSFSDNDYEGNIVFNNANSITLTLDADVMGVKNTCVYELTK